jgi:CRISPR-associated endoribonuclease Cas6
LESVQIYYWLICIIWIVKAIKGAEKVSVANHIEILTLRASFQAEESGTLPAYLGSTIRGILGHCMREAACTNPGVQCHLCHVSADCEYARSFNSPGNVAGAVNPFVIHAPVRDKTAWKAGDPCNFNITILGKATQAAEFYLNGLIAMGKRGWGVNRMRFSISHITNSRNNTLVWSGGKTWPQNLKASPLNVNEKQAKSVLIQFDTPTRILVKRQLCKRLTFENIVQSLVRRISLLSHAYSSKRMEWDEDELIEKAKNIRTLEENWRFVDFKRYSITYDKKLALPAIEGWARYEGDLTPFTELLEAGKRFHIGKNATHGFGHYKVFWDN